MSVFRTLAGGLFDGVNVAITAATGFTAIVRTQGVANGSWDITFANPNPAPSTRCIALVTPEHIANHNLSPDYTWVNVAADGSSSTLRVTLRDDTATLTDAVFGVEVRRISAKP